MSAPSLPTASATRSRLAPGAKVGVTEPMIRDLVHAFYRKVYDDPDLGPVFAAAIAEGAWDSHLARMCDFWSSVTLMTRRFNGAPMAVHAAMEGLTPALFARWLALFTLTAREVCPGPAADLFVARAKMIAESLQLGRAAMRGELPARRGAGEGRA